MPLVAVLADTRVEAWTLDDVGWADLKRRYRSGESLTMVCGRPGVPKRSSRGLRFFAHKPGEDCGIHATAPESAEHHETKRLVAEAARAAGWTATVEAPGADRSWIADVLLERDGRRVIVEAQWAAEVQMQERTERYLAAGIDRVLWLLGPKNHARAGDVDSELVRAVDGSIEILLPGPYGSGRRWVGLSAGFTELLLGQHRTEAELVATELYVAVRQTRCWTGTCARWLTSWHLLGIGAQSRCGGSAIVELSHGHYQAWAKRRPETAVQDLVLRALRGSDLAAPARWDWRTSKEVPDGYVARVCPNCGVMQGDAYSDGRWQQHRIPLEAPLRFPFGRDGTAVLHLCVDAGRGRCEAAADAPKTTWERGGAMLSHGGGWLELETAPELPKRRGVRRG